jgi:hypothetical protein
MRRAALPSLPLVVAFLGFVAAPHAAWVQRGAAVAPPATIPFELATRHIIVPVSVNGSRPLSFVLDTGANGALIRSDVARELGLAMEGRLNVGGAGPGTQSGQFVRRATWTLAGLAGFSQPLTVALPLTELPAAMGRPVDGIIGGQFIQQFVVEVDYQAKTLRLHDPAAFSYRGSGESMPIDFVNVTHPVVTAIVTPAGGTPIERRFLFDIGSGGAVILHSPFVAEQKLLGPGSKTIQAIGGAGAGGRTAGRIGRIESLRLGSFTIQQPIAMFSQDQAGALANPALAGNIGSQIAMRFRLFLDYGRRRLILEPSAIFDQPFDRAFSGLALRAQGADFRTFRVHEVLDDSPATDAGIREGDIIAAVDDVPSSRLTLSDVNNLFEVAATYTLTIQRGSETLRVTLTPRRMV